MSDEFTHLDNGDLNDSVFSKINKRFGGELYDLMLALVIYKSFPNLKTYFGFIEQNFWSLWRIHNPNGNTLKPEIKKFT